MCSAAGAQCVCRCQGTFVENPITKECVCPLGTQQEGGKGVGEQRDAVVWHTLGLPVLWYA